MSIQQNLNQLLSLYGVGAGLYSQTPQGKERLEVRGLEQRIPKIDEVFSKGLEEAQKKDEAARAAGIENTTFERDFLDTIGQEALSTSANLSERLAMLRPTEEHFKRAREDRYAAEEMRTASDEKPQSEDPELANPQFPTQRIKPRQYEHEQGTPHPNYVVPASNEWLRRRNEERKYNEILDKAVQSQIRAIQEKAGQADAKEERMRMLRELRDEGVLSGNRYKSIIYKLNQTGGNQ